MKILLIFDEGFPIEQVKFLHLLRQKSKFIKFDHHKSDFSLKSGLD